MALTGSRPICISHLELKYSAIIWHTEIITALTIVIQTHMKHLKYCSAVFSYECQMHSIKKNTKIPQQIKGLKF